MKKISFILTVLILSTFLTISLSGCSGGGKTGSGSALFSFETDAEMKAVEMKNFFGRYSVNKDTQYVKNGLQSLKLTPTGIGLAEVVDKPTLVLNLAKLENDVTDFTQVDSVVFDIYNDADEQKSVNLYIDAKTVTGTARAGHKSFFLNAKGWTKVIYPINYYELSYLYDLSVVKNINFEFVPLDYTVTPTDFYLDNLSLKTSSVPRGKISFELDDLEICSFDKDYQKYMVYPTGWGNIAQITPVLSINTDTDYTKTGAGKSLRVDMPCSMVFAGAWPMFKFSDYLYQNFDLTEYADTHELVCDVYNASDILQRFEFQFRSESKTAAKSYARNMYVPAHSWYEFRLALSDVNALTDGNNFLGQVTTMAVVWDEFTGTPGIDDRVSYFDNFRLELK